MADSLRGLLGSVDAVDSRAWAEQAETALPALAENRPPQLRVEDGRKARDSGAFAND